MRPPARDSESQVEAATVYEGRGKHAAMLSHEVRLYRHERLDLTLQRQQDVRLHHMRADSA